MDENDYPVFIEFETEPSNIGSNYIVIKDKAIVENNKPYTVPEFNGDWNKYFPTPGRYLVKADPYTKANKGGEKGSHFYLLFMSKRKRKSTMAAEERLIFT